MLHIMLISRKFRDHDIEFCNHNSVKMKELYSLKFEHFLQRLFEFRNKKFEPLFLKKNTRPIIKKHNNLFSQFFHSKSIFVVFPQCVILCYCFHKIRLLYLQHFAQQERSNGIVKKNM